MFEGDDFKYKFDLNYSLYDFFMDNKKVINIEDSSIKTLEALDRVMAEGVASLLYVVLNDCEKENYIFLKENYQLTNQFGQLVKNNIFYNQLTNEQINNALDGLKKSLDKYNDNFVFNMINQYDDQFNLVVDDDE
ncbi:MAG: hypothetical protein ACK5LC_02840 [Coprobacillaceae bacterium]